MYGWRVIIEGEAAGRRFLRTAFVGAATRGEAKQIARAELENDGDQFVKVAEVTCEKSPPEHPGLLSISARIFFG